MLDVRLPDIDGFEVAERIKGDPRDHRDPGDPRLRDRRPRRWTVPRASTAAPTPTWPSRSTRTSCSPRSGRSCGSYRARRRAERLAGRLTRLVATTTAFNAATSLTDLLLAPRPAPPGSSTARPPSPPAPQEPGPIAVQVDAVDGAPQLRPAMREPYEFDPLDGQAGTLLFRQESGPWWPGAVWRVVARAKPGREPLHVAVPAEGFSDDDADLLRQFGQAVALAVEALRSYDEERRTALTLQQSMLPQRLPSVPGVQLAVRYQPASDHASVGGDFYEILLLDAAARRGDR